MKKLFIILFLLLPLLSWGVNYYPKSTGDLSLTTNWGTATNGTGTNPTNFTNMGNIFIVNKSGVINNPWVVSNLTIGTTSPTTTGSLTLSAVTTVQGVLTLTRGTITSNGNLTINLNTGNIAGTGIGTITGNITVTKNIPSKGWHYLGSPLTNVTLAQFNDNTVVKASTSYYYDETIVNTDKQVGWISNTNLSSPITIGNGYILYYYNPGVIDMTGLYTHGANYTENVTHTPSGNNSADGWNLVGNPYPSTLDWDIVVSNNDVGAFSAFFGGGIDDAIYYWDGNLKIYKTYVNGAGTNSATKYVPSLQSFFVHKRKRLLGGSSNFNLDFTNDVRIPSVVAPLFRTATSDNMLRISASSALSSDETIVRISEFATDTFDGYWDAYKMYNGDNAPSIYTTTDINYSINSLAEVEYKELPLSLFYSVADSIMLDFENTLNDYQVVLKDNKLQTTQTIQANDSYQFYYNTQDDSTRFTLILTKNILTSNLEPITSNHLNLLITSQNGVITVNNPDNYTVGIYSLSGQLYSESTDKVINTQVGTGLYLVKGISNQETYTTKVFIK